MDSSLCLHQCLTVHRLLPHGHNGVSNATPFHDIKFILKLYLGLKYSNSLGQNFLRTAVCNSLSWFSFCPFSMTDSDLTHNLKILPFRVPLSLFPSPQISCRLIPALASASQRTQTEPYNYKLLNCVCWSLQFWGNLLQKLKIVKKKRVVGTWALERKMTHLRSKGSHGQWTCQKPRSSHLEWG